MKHLKKLSVVLILTTLFSVSFTSCIDDEVSPVVEAIYQGQADLLAAQAAVNNAEAVLRLAQANAQDGLAAQYAANAAATTAASESSSAEAAEVLRLAIAENDQAIARAQLALDLATANFEVTMAGIMAQLDAAGAQQAIDYAYDYRNAMNAANAIQSDLLVAQGNLADAELMLVGAPGSEVSYAYSLAMLENSVAIAQAKVDDTQAKLDLFNANAEDPIATKELLDAQKIDLRSQYEALQKQREDQVQVIGLIDFNEGERDTYTTELTGGAGTPLFDHNANKTTQNSNLDDIETAEGLIEGYQEAIDNYADVTTTLTTAVTDAQTAVDDAKAALGMEDAAENTPAVGLYYEVDADGVDAIAIGGAKYAAPANLQETLVNARIDLLDAADDYNTYNSDIAALVLSYNNAAVALEAAQAAFDGNTYAADLTNAETDLATAQSDWDDAMTAYTDAKTAFEVAPAGSVDNDRSFADAQADISAIVDDLGELGIVGDGNAKTYMKVNSIDLGDPFAANDNVPDGFFPTKYTAAEMQANVTAMIALNTTAVDPALVAGGTSGVYNFSGPTDFWVIDQQGQVFYSNDLSTVVATGSTIPDASVAAGLSTSGSPDVLGQIYIEVESDDTSLTNLQTFNIATNMLGNNDFSARDFDIVTPNYLVDTADDSATYDVSPDAITGKDNTTSIIEASDEFTAYAVLWNAQLAVAIAQDAFDTGEDGLIAAQEAFDYQKELFDVGVANLAVLKSTMDTASDDKDAAEEAVDDAWVALGQSFAEGEVGDTPREVGDAVPTDSLTLSEVLYNAEIVLDTHLDTDVATYEGWIVTKEDNIATWEAENVKLQVLIDAQYAVVAELLGELTAIGVEYTFEVDDDGLGQFTVTNDLSGNYTDLSAEIIAANKVLWDIDQEIAIVQDKRTMANALISQWDSSYDTFVNTTIPGLESSLVIAQTDLAKAEAALALAENEETAATANIAYLQALIDTYLGRHANALAIAAKYKALLDAALAS